VPRPPRHAFTAAVRRTLPRPLDRSAESYLRLLDRRFAALARLAAGEGGVTAAGLRPADRALARRQLAARAGGWHDGDENLVRGHLDRWDRSPQRSAAAPARALLEGAGALVAIGAPPGALWFFLWEMESILAGLAPADKQESPC
jgi:hypothetical protein